MGQKASGKAHHMGLSLLEIADKFRDKDCAREWIEGIRWQHGSFFTGCGMPSRKNPTSLPAR